eukprot:scaffold9273_cov90-Skeletonema_dohrnii-CCMP3373.AAC.2
MRQLLSSVLTLRTNVILHHLYGSEHPQQDLLAFITRWRDSKFAGSGAMHITAWELIIHKLVTTLQNYVIFLTILGLGMDLMPSITEARVILT